MSRSLENAKSRKAFQNLSVEVNRLYAENNNYLIEYSESVENPIPYCIVYFSSNNIYYPDSKEVFYEQIIRNDRYEWCHTRIDSGTKHIFMRDIKKQHYMTGVNSRLDTIEKLIDFLKAETEGYKTITVGSSSGGYAAVLFGQQLNAERIYSFNGQFVLDVNNPVFHKIEKSILRKYYKLQDFLKMPSTVFYFHSNKSTRDIYQFKCIKNTGIHTISFDAKVHGVPFLKSCLPIVLNLSIRDLKILSNKRHNTLLFSINMVGIWLTLTGFFKELQELLREQALTRNLKNALGF